MKAKDAYIHDMKRGTNAFQHTNLWKLGDVKLNGYTTYCSQVCMTLYLRGLTKMSTSVINYCSQVCMTLSLRGLTKMSTSFVNYCSQVCVTLLRGGLT